jgi:hypothetical protein
MIDRRTHQDEMLHIRAIAQHAVNSVFEKTGIGKVQAFINSNGQCSIGDNDRVAIHITEVVCSGQLPNERKVRLARIVEMQKQREHDARGYANLNAKPQRHHNRCCHGRKI